MDELARDDAAHLKSLRMAADLDHAQLALMANLSAGQVRQLEDDGDSLFYSPQIKAQSLRRVIRLLETASQEQQHGPVIEPPVHRSSASVIDDIIRLSEKNLKSQVVHSQVRRPGGVWSKLFGVWGLALILLVLGLWQYNRHNTQGLYTEWVEPMTAKVLPAAPSTNTEPVNVVVPEIIAPPPATLKTEAVAAPTLPLTATPVAPTVKPPATPVAPTPTVAAEPVVAKTEPPAIKPPVAKEVVASAAEIDCANIKSEPVTVASVSPHKPGSYEYLVASKTTTVCVDDGKNKRTLVTLTPGAGRSIHGAAPWTVATSDMKSVQVFFQGAKVWVPPEAGSRIYLKEQPISP
jgi:hypothetical protein